MSESAPASRTALIVGVTGGFGQEVARALDRHGWSVRALHRDPNRAQKRLPDLRVSWIPGDALNAGDVEAAAEGARILIHAANPPGYRRWRELAIPMLANALHAAKVSGARLLFPGNIYNFGPDAGSVLREDSPQNPKTRKGAVRVDMERRIAEAAAAGEARSLIVRAGDFLGATPNSWYAAVMVKSGQPLRAVTYPGRRDVGHAWAYLPDLAETFVRLAEIEADLPAFDVYHFGGHWIEPGVEIAHATRRAAGKSDLPIRRFPWPAVYLAAPFVPFMRELLEMRYLWRVPLRLDNSKLTARLGEEPHTPLDEALRETLRRMRVL